MRILIQNCKTKQYLTNDRDWTADQSGAAVFGSTTLAMKYSNAHRLTDVQVVLKFPEDRYDVHIPLTDGCREDATAPAF
jgi:hypothetical protein